MSTAVCHLSTVHRADDMRIFVKECRTLAAAGYPVTFAVPPLPETGAAATTDRQRDDVIRVPLPRYRTRWQRMTLGVLAAFRAALRSRARLIHVHDPELLPAAWVLRMLGRCVIYDVHEDVAAAVHGKTYLPRWLRPPLAVAVGFVEAVLAATMSAIVAATPAIARRFRNRRVIVVQNFPIADELASETAAPARPEPVAVFVGGITAGRGAAPMVEAIGRSRAERLVLAGPVRPGSLLTQLQALSGWEKVEHHPWLDRRAVAELLAGASVGLVLYQPEPNHVEAQPTKLFEYLSAGLPVIASDFPRWREILDGEAGCLGWLVDPGDPQAIAAAVDQALEAPDTLAAMGRRGRAAVAERFNWAVEGDRLVRLYRVLEC